jgi:phage/plasmid-like protein (TIGR03299 family)
VVKTPVYAMTSDGFIDVESHNAVVRDWDQSVLGIVGSGYEPIQNERIFDWAEAVRDTGQAEFTTGGSLRGGRIVFACMEVDVNVDVPGGDRILPYFVVASSHDGSQAMKAFTSATRVVCANTLAIAEKAAKSQFTIRHTANADFRLDAARRMLGMVVGYYDEFSKRAHAMIAQSVSDSEWKQLISLIFPTPKEEQTNRQKDALVHRRRGLNALYHGETIGGFTGTAWGAMNAVNEWELWGQRVKGERAERQALRVLNNDFPLTKTAEKYLASL